MKWDERKHPRDEVGRFCDGSGGTHVPSENEKQRLREIGVDGKPQLSKQEYAVLRAEVMRKNVAQKGKAKPVNFVFTANMFHVYSTSGEDDFTLIKSLNIEEEPEVIDFYINLIEGKK